MIAALDWPRTPPTASAAMTACITIPGSMTDHLMATGHQFAVGVLAQGTAPVHDDETVPLDLAPGRTLYARHVVITLDDVPVLVARSVTRLDCAVWQPILDRGRRSLGLTLFGGVLPDLVREPLTFRDIAPDHPLFELAQMHDPSEAPHYPARRARFVLEGAPLIVCEVFLPSLEAFLR
jgi:chorismate--pyruvate lyase